MTPNENRRTKRGSVIRNKNQLSLSTQVIPEISHESQDDERTVLSNGHQAYCNINRHLRFDQENSVAVKCEISPPNRCPNRIISVIEEASV